MVKFFLSILIVLILAFGSLLFAQQAKPADAPLTSDSVQSLKALTSADLITKLQEESNEGIGFDTMAWASGFIAIDEEPQFRGGIMGSPKPKVSPVMRELVRRGLAALPMLIDHLSDARSTKLIVGRGSMGKWFDEEYDPREQRMSNEPSRIKMIEKTMMNPQKSFDQYTVRVGDLCFVAIGQIVNRNLNAVRYQPSLCLVVNSPVENPALAAAVKADWSGLTSADFERSLEQDALNPDAWGAETDAMKRLLFYYPVTGNPLAIKMLNRSFYDSNLAYRFFNKSLVHAKDVKQQDKLLADFRKENGELNYRAIARCLIQVSTFPKSQMTPERTRNKVVADQLLARLFPDVDPVHPPFMDIVDVQAQRSLVNGVAAFHSQEMDKAIFQVLQRIVALRFDKYADKFEQWELAYACARQLVKPEEREALALSHEKFCSEVGKAEANSKDTFVEKRVEKYLQDLIKQFPS